MKKYLKSRFFLTKVLPTLFFSIFAIPCVCYAIFANIKLSTFDIIVITVAAILLLNLYLRQYWLSYIIGAISVLSFFYLVFAVLSEYSEFPNLASLDALRLLIVGLLLCLSGMTVGILLIIPFKSAK